MYPANQSLILPEEVGYFSPVLIISLLVCLIVYLFAPPDYFASYEWILIKFFVGVGRGRWIRSD